MAYRFYNPAPVFFDLLGLQPVAGGSLQFYEIGTTTPKGTWSDPDMTIPNANPVPLDSSGRANTNIWLDGAYSVRLLDSLGATIWTRDVDSGVDESLTIPALQSGKFLTNDGSTLQWDSVRQVPDPTGSANKILSTDGSDLIWIAQPVPPVIPIANTGTSVKIGTLLIQWGTGQLPATGNRQSSVSVGFPTAFSSTPYAVMVVPTNNTHTAGGQIGVCAVTSKAVTGFGVIADTDDFGQTNATFIAPEPFDWVAFGPTTA